MTAVIRTMFVRVLQIGIVAFFVTAGINLLVRLVPGDPARTILGDKASPQALDALRQELGLDRPVMEQLAASLGRLLHGDLGTSFVHRGQDVITLIGPTLVVTGSLTAAAILFSLLIGVPAGLWMALVRSPSGDLGGRLAMTILLALPSFTAALILLYFASLELRLAPAGGWAGAWPANFRYIWLPALALSAYLGALIARSVRQAAIDALGQPFVEAARTRGIPRSRIVLFHILPNAILPVITLVAFNAGILIGSAVTVEAVFALPGLGAQLLQATNTRDLPVVQGIALLTAVAVVVINLLADLLNIAVDPRLRRSH